MPVKHFGSGVKEGGQFAPAHGMGTPSQVDPGTQAHASGDSLIPPSQANISGDTIVPPNGTMNVGDSLVPPTLGSLEGEQEEAEYQAGEQAKNKKFEAGEKEVKKTQKAEDKERKTRQRGELRSVERQYESVGKAHEKKRQREFNTLFEAGAFAVPGGGEADYDEVKVAAFHAKTDEFFQTSNKLELQRLGEIGSKHEAEDKAIAAERDKSLIARIAASEHYEKSDDNADTRARRVDLVVLPPSIDGATCGNCMYFEHDHCKHIEVLQPVEPHYCCSRWDAPGTVHVGRGG